MTIMSLLPKYLLSDTISLFIDPIKRYTVTKSFCHATLTAVLLIRSVSAVILTVTHKRVSNTLPVSALELSGVTAVGDHCACQFIRLVVTLGNPVTHLPFGDAHVVSATKLGVKTAVGR